MSTYYKKGDRAYTFVHPDGTILEKPVEVTIDYEIGGDSGYYVVKEFQDFVNWENQDEYDRALEGPSLSKTYGECLQEQINFLIGMREDLYYEMDMVSERLSSLIFQKNRLLSEANDKMKVSPQESL